MTNHELVKKVIGNINPVGESHTDTERLENLEQMCNLVKNLLYDIDDVISRNTNNKQSSVEKCVDYARHFMQTTVKEIS